MQLVFASNNKIKLKKFNKFLIDNDISLEDIGCHEEIQKLQIQLKEMLF
jgi:inosine/xanthosine triphosphate pyrophosphatase family protein